MDKQLTFGEKLVGIGFNPSADPKVQRAKEICAELANMINDHMHETKDESSALQYALYHHAVGEILNAQMTAVKLLTFKPNL